MKKRSRGLAMLSASKQAGQPGQPPESETSAKQVRNDRAKSTTPSENRVDTENSTTIDDLPFPAKLTDFQSQHHSIYTCFRHLESVLSILLKQRQLSDFRTVRLKYHELAGLHLNTEDIAAIHHVLNVYSFETLPSETGDNFKINFNYDIIPLQKNDTSMTVFLSRRLDVFRESLDGRLELVVTGKSRFYFESFELPIITANHASEKPIKRVPRRSFAPWLVKEASAAASSIAAAVNMEEIRELAAERGRNEEAKREAMEISIQQGIHKQRLAASLKLCDCLRNKLLQIKRTSWPISDLVKQLAVDMRVAESELSLQLKLLSTLVPEFVTIIPGDDLICVPVLRLNMSTPYGLVRQKLKDGVRS